MRLRGCEGGTEIGIKGGFEAGMETRRQGGMDGGREAWSRSSDDPTTFVVC